MIVLSSHVCLSLLLRRSSPVTPIVHGRKTTKDCSRWISSSRCLSLISFSTSPSSTSTLNTIETCFVWSPCHRRYHRHRRYHHQCQWPYLHFWSSQIETWLRASEILWSSEYPSFELRSKGPRKSWKWKRANWASRCFLLREWVTSRWKIIILACQRIETAYDAKHQML